MVFGIFHRAQLWFCCALYKLKNKVITERNVMEERGLARIQFKMRFGGFSHIAQATTWEFVDIISILHVYFTGTG